VHQRGVKKERVKGSYLSPTWDRTVELKGGERVEARIGDIDKRKDERIGRM
jgi:hypothetical protein